jgi:hypothetical protein
MTCACLAGCGGGGGDPTSGNANGNGESFMQLVTGLHGAALAHRAFDATSRAQTMKPVLRDTIDSFCETNRQMVEGAEAWKVGNTHYYLTRIRDHAEQGLPFFSTSYIEEAIATMGQTITFSLLTAKQLALYVRPCYR